MDKCIKGYNKSISDNLKTLTYRGQPKEYWDILNSSGKKNKPSVDIIFMYEFMKKTSEIADQDNEIDINVDVSNNTIPNQTITSKEIKNAVKKLKNMKAPGGDQVVNEYIKTTILT